MPNETNTLSAPDYLVWRNSTERAGFTVSKNASAMLLLEERQAGALLPLTQLVTDPAATRLQAAQLGAIVAQLMLANPKLESLRLQLDFSEERDGQGKVYERVRPSVYQLGVDGGPFAQDSVRWQVEDLLIARADDIQLALKNIFDERGDCDFFLSFHRGTLAETLDDGQIAGRWSGWATFAAMYPRVAERFSSRVDAQARQLARLAEAKEPVPHTPLAVAAQAGRDALEKLDSWLVCWPLATPEDMAQSFQGMQEVAGAACEALNVALKALAGPTDHLSSDQLVEALKARGYVVTTFCKDDLAFIEEDADLPSLSPDQLAAVKERAIAAAAENLEARLGPVGNAALEDWWVDHKQEILASLPPSEIQYERHR
jgi:hypothetical protein